MKQQLRGEVGAHGSRNLIAKESDLPGLRAIGKGSMPQMVGSLLLLGWLLMLIFYGEGLDLDMQRRRHPVWEWLFAHPISAGAVFFAEMLSPLGANPVYWAAPLFVGML